MLLVSTKESLVCYAFVSVRLNGLWALLGQSKFEVLTLFLNVWYCSGFTYIMLRDTMSVIWNQWGDRIQMLLFWTYYKIAKFT